MKVLTTFLLGSTILKAFGLSIVYKGNAISSEDQYKIMMGQIEREEGFKNYLDTREKIKERSTYRGPLIDPHWIVYGAHIENFQDSQIVSDRVYPLSPHNIDEKVTGIFKRVPNTDLALRSIYRVANDSMGNENRPLLGMSVTAPATIDDITNPRNQFYALSAVLHGDNLAIKEGNSNCSDVHPDLTSIVRCKPTVSNPQVNRVLRFDIDDDANPCLFRTHGGDSTQGFFVVTESNQIKIVGSHNPAEDHFMVENIAYPLTTAFINETIETVPEPFTICTMGSGICMLFRKRKTILKSKIKFKGRDLNLTL